MDANTPVTSSGPDGNPIKDRVDVDKGREPAVESAVDGPAATGPAARGQAARGPARPKGPNASAIVVGLVALVFAGLIIAREALAWHVDWSRLGPGGIIGIGVVMVVIGAIGLVRRHDDL
jgi:5,10-methenyltetrahydromethanopterin hydrogenase